MTPNPQPGLVGGLRSGVTGTKIGALARQWAGAGFDISSDYRFGLKHPHLPHYCCSCSPAHQAVACDRASELGRLPRNAPRPSGPTRLREVDGGIGFGCVSWPNGDSIDESAFAALMRI